MSQKLNHFMDFNLYNLDENNYPSKMIVRLEHFNVEKISLGNDCGMLYFKTKKKSFTKGNTEYDMKFIQLVKDGIKFYNAAASDISYEHGLMTVIFKPYAQCVKET